VIQLNCFYNLKWKHLFGAISADHQQNKSTSSLSAVIFFVYNALLINGIENTASVAAIKLHFSNNPHV
jgi:hypothetical protein